MARKSGSRRHSITGFSENVAVAEICYQRKEVLSFCDRPGEGLAISLMEITMQTLLVKKQKKQNKNKRKQNEVVFRGVYFLRIR